MAKLEKIGIWGYNRHGISDGFGYAGYKLVSAFNKLGINTVWESQDAPVAISFVQPQDYGGNSNQYRVGYTPWESTKLPEGWIEEMQKMDDIWTPSTWCKQIFEENGIKDVKVFPHGIDSEDWSLSRHEKTNPFIFLHMGEPADRKNGQMVFNAFREVFGLKIYDARLHFKAVSWVEARNYDNQGSIISAVSDYPGVTIDTGVRPVSYLNDMFAGVNCLVYPSAGEGFGLIPFQAVATGLPSIFPKYSGMVDIPGGIDVDYKIGASNHGIHLGDWAYPNFEDLCAKMLDVYQQYPSYAESAFEQGKYIQENFKWTDIAKSMVSELEKRI